jgi:hypothetical protein
VYICIYMYIYTYVSIYPVFRTSISKMSSDLSNLTHHSAICKQKLQVQCQNLPLHTAFSSSIQLPSLRSV